MKLDDAKDFIKDILKAKNDSRIPEFWKKQLDLLMNKVTTKLYVLDDQDPQVAMIKADFAKTKPDKNVIKVEVI